MGEYLVWERLALKGECSDKAYNRENGLNFLQVAFIAGDVKATEYLLNQSDGKKLAHELVSCSKRSALTALQLAYTLGHFEILKLLLRYANEYGIMMATERSMPDLSVDVGSSYLRQDSHSMHPHKQMKADRPEFMKFE